VDIAVVVASALYALGNLLSASLKYRKDPRIVALMSAVGVPPGRLWVLATVQVAGALGLVAGLAWPPLGVAAAIGLLAYFLAAIGAHLRAKDPGFQGALVMAVLAAVVLVLRLLTL
jgi:uncharacterized membrane protein YphA (DoxX/SURF4 family)